MPYIKNHKAYNILSLHKVQGGFTLVEVLIAVLVLSIGLLGLAALQLNSLRNNDSAAMRSQATFFANDILDRMRANRTDALAGNYNLAMAATPATPGGGGDCDGGDNCSATQMRVFDLDEWITTIAAALPLGDASVATTVISGKTIFTITIQWDDTRGVGAAQQFATSTEI